MLRTTRSPILNEARDFVTGIYDDRGRMLEQCEYVPILAHALRPALASVIDFFGNDLHPGDIIMHNDVFHRGNQLPDVAIFKPIFYKGELVAWSACKGHQADIGGAVAGGYNPHAKEIWQEGLRIPPVKVYKEGKLVRDVWDLIFANIRFPIVQEDIKAEIGGCVVGERGIIKLIERYGLDKFRAHIEELFNATERAMRKEIEAIPDGAYHGESYMYYDGINEGSRYKIAVTITVKGDEITFDYTGTDPQAPGFTNATLSGSTSAMLITLLNCINPDIPHNEGMLRPIHIHIPEGTFLNAKFPAATTFGNHITDPHSEAIMKALSRAIPEKVTAAWNRMLAFAVTGFDPRKDRPYVDILFNAMKGGSGATYGCDGYDHIGLPMRGGGESAQDPEIFEIQDPHFLIKFEYLPDSAGPGKWRGGLGVETIFRFDGTNTRGIVFGDGVEEESRAFGLFGGLPGSINKIEFIYPYGSIRVPRSKEMITDILPGTIFRQLAGGGGGYGDPKERPREKVLEELRDGLISLRTAREIYGLDI